MVLTFIDHFKYGFVNGVTPILIILLTLYCVYYEIINEDISAMNDLC